MSSANIVVNFIDPINREKGIKSKQAVLSKLSSKPGFDDFKSTLILAYDPMITFGMSSKVFWDCTRAARKMGDYHFKNSKTSGHKDHFSGKVFPFLQDLACKAYSGNELLEYVSNSIYNHFDSVDCGLISRILDKDLKIGLGPSSINKVYEDLLFDFGVMLASPFDGAKLEFPSFVEPKYDGMRVLIVADKMGPVKFLTRTGHELDSERFTEEFLKDLACVSFFGLETLQCDRIVLDGELMGTSFQDTMQKAKMGEGKFDTAKLYIFDALDYLEFYKMKGHSKLDYKTRRANLRTVFEKAEPDYRLTHILLPQAYIVNSEAEIRNYYDVFRSKGHEGLIIKRANGVYRLRRNADWMKMKAFETLDLPIVGVVEGTGKYVGNLGALVVNHKGVHVHVGTGLSDAQRKEIWADWNSGRSMIGTLVEVGYQEITPDNSLRHPRFVRFRTDKESVNEEAWG